MDNAARVWEPLDSLSMNRERLGSRASNSKTQRLAQMKSPNVENIVVDEAHELTYIVKAPRILTDGEMFSAIRIALLKRGGKFPGKGETLVITTSNMDKEGSFSLSGPTAIIPMNG